jgi:chaperonin GroEL (HSP60 family)
MLSKKINFGCTFKKIYDQYQSQEIILKTCQTVSKVASITLGPKGRNVLI